MMQNFEHVGFGAEQKSTNLVDLEESCNAKYIFSKIGVDTADNEPPKVCMK